MKKNFFYIFFEGQGDFHILTYSNSFLDSSHLFSVYGQSVSGIFPLFSRFFLSERGVRVQILSNHGIGLLIPDSPFIVGLGIGMLWNFLVYGRLCIILIYIGPKLNRVQKTYS